MAQVRDVKNAARAAASECDGLLVGTGGRNVEETVAKLSEVSERVKERLRSDPGYARVTVENAAKFVSQNYGKSRSRA